MSPLPSQLCIASSIRDRLPAWIASCCLALLAGIAAAQVPPPAAKPKPTLPTLPDPASISTQVLQLLPATIALLQAVEATAMARGRALTQDEMQTAHRLGVAQPQRIRVLVTPVLPNWLAPDAMANPALANGSAVDAEHSTPQRHYGVAGLTAGHGILLGIRYANNPRVLAHELAHVAQYERLGMRAFALRYLTELLSVGYFRAPLELEADSAMRRVLSIPQQVDIGITKQTRH